MGRREIVLARGPVSYWRLGDSGTTAIDETSLQNGTYVGGPVSADFRPPVVDDGHNSTLFSNSSQKVSIPDHPYHRHFTDFSMEAWIYCTDNSGYNYIFSKWGQGEYLPSDDDDFWELAIFPGGAIRFSYRGDDHSILIADRGYVNLYEWHQILYARHDNVFYGYLDGVRILDAVGTGAPMNNNVGEPCYIGWGTYQPLHYFRGYIAEVSLYNHIWFLISKFSGTPTLGSLPLTVNFTDESIGPVTGWSWDFGDGSPLGTEQSPTHVYTTQGVFTVTLTVSNLSTTDNLVKSNYITAFTSLRLLACGGDGWSTVRDIWGSVNGTSWCPLFSDSSYIGEFVAVSQGSGSTVLALTSFGNIFRSTDRGLNWVNLGNKVAACATSPNGISVGALTWVGGNSFLAGSSYLYRTQDKGNTWVEVNASEHLPVHAIIELDDTRLLYSSDGLCFKSFDRGITWSPAGSFSFYPGATTNQRLSFTDFGSGVVVAVGATNTGTSWGQPILVVDVSTDYGDSWSSKYVSYPTDYSILFAVEATGSDDAVASGYSAWYGTAPITTSNKGQNWSTGGAAPNFCYSLLWVSDIGLLSGASEHIYVDGHTVLSVPGRRVTDIIELIGVVLTADFSGTPLSGSAPLSVQFTDESSGSPTSWEWHFGDGATSTDASPTHAYNRAGIYDVSLTISDGSESDTKTKSSYVNVGMSTDFTVLPSSSTYPYSTLRFQDSTIGTPDTWEWSFGDGTTSNLQNPTKGYARSGYYTVTLTSSNSSKTDTETKFNYIHVNLVGTAQKLNYIHTIGTLNTWDVALAEEFQSLSVMTARGTAKYLVSAKGARVTLGKETAVLFESGFKRAKGPTLIFD